MNSHIVVGNEVFIGAAGSPVRAKVVSVGTGKVAYGEGWVTVEKPRVAIDRQGNSVLIPDQRMVPVEMVYPTYEAAQASLRARGW